MPRFVRPKMIGKFTKAYSSLIETTKINSLEDFLQTPFFYNEKIKVGGVSIKNKLWNDKGVYFINDIMKKFFFTKIILGSTKLQKPLLPTYLKIYLQS